MSELEKIWRSSFVPSDRRHIADWAAENIFFPPGSPYPGPFKLENAPWIKRIFDAYLDPMVRRITVTGCPQESVKTTTSQVIMLWQMSVDPTFFGFYPPTDIKAKEFVDTRLEPMIETCPAFKRRIRDQLKQRILMRDGTYLLVKGADSERSRQSDTLRCIIKDEFQLWSNLMSKEVDNRTRAYVETDDWKVVEIGTGPDVGTVHDAHMKLGTSEEWHVPCPHTGTPFRLIWNKKQGGVFAWDEVHDGEGRVLVDESARSARIISPHSGKEIKWDRDWVNHMRHSGFYQPMNSTPAEGSVSLRIPRFVPGKTKLSEIVKKWIRIGAGREIGKAEALKDFIVYDLAEPWEAQPDTNPEDIRTGDYTISLDISDRWDREIMRAAAIDYQHGMRGDTPHFWFAVRAFADNGDSRLIDCGREDDAQDLSARLQAAGVEQIASVENWEYSRVSIDCAFDPDTIYELCARHLWMAVRGEDRDSRRGGDGRFRHRDSDGVITFEHFSEVKWAKIGVGRAGNMGHAPWISWSSQGIQQLLHEIRNSREIIWEIPENIDEICEVYRKHLASHVRKNVSNDPGRPHWRWERMGSAEKYPDHLFDCECMLVAFALRAGLYQIVGKD